MDKERDGIKIEEEWQRLDEKRGIRALGKEKERNQEKRKETRKEEEIEIKEDAIGERE